MNTEYQNNQSHWIIGDTEIYEMVKDASVQGKEGVLLHISTSIQSLSSLNLSHDRENQLMFKAWKLSLSRLPKKVIGKRSDWRSLMFLIVENAEKSIGYSKEILDTLQADADLNSLTWRLVLSPVGRPWDHAFRLAEAEAHEVTKNAKHGIIVWVEGAFDNPYVKTI
jgi:hypothetical protein